MPKATGKNSIIVQDILADLKSSTLSGRDTGHPFLFLKDMIRNLLRLRGEHRALTGSQLILACEMGIIPEVPDISKSEIEEKSIGDHFVKFLAVVHTIWHIAQLIARCAEKHPASQIETATGAFALCAFLDLRPALGQPSGCQNPVYAGNNSISYSQGKCLLGGNWTPTRHGDVHRLSIFNSGACPPPKSCR